jgi:hypothetical protein
MMGCSNLQSKVGRRASKRVAEAERQTFEINPNARSRVVEAVRGCSGRQRVEYSHSSQSPVCYDALRRPTRSAKQASLAACPLINTLCSCR